MVKIYLASPFFNELEVEKVKQVSEILDNKGLVVFSPMENQMEHLEGGTRHWSIETFINDKKFIDSCDVVVAIYHGNYSDSGTAWEMGYAYGINKPVITIHVGNNSNLMVHEGSHANLTLDELKLYDFDMLGSKTYTGEMF